LKGVKKRRVPKSVTKRRVKGGSGNLLLNGTWSKLGGEENRTDWGFSGLRIEQGVKLRGANLKDLSFTIRVKLEEPGEPQGGGEGVIFSLC